MTPSKLKYWMPVLIYAGMIFYLSSIPYLQLPGKAETIDPDKLFLHIIEYSGFGLLVFIALINSKDFNSYFSALILTTFIGFFYGITDEIHQYFVPNRFPNLNDIIADGLGTLIGGMIGIIVAKKKY